MAITRFTSMHNTIVATSTADPKSYTVWPSFTTATDAQEIMENFTQCTNYSNVSLVCDKVPLAEIQKMFIRTPFPDLLDSVALMLQPYIFSETKIPVDVFGVNRMRRILLEYPYGTFINRSLSLQIDPNAFRSTKSYTNKFELRFIDCTLLDLSFLSGFDNLTELWFFHTDSIQHCLLSLPPLPKLTRLEFFSCEGMNELPTFPSIINGLNKVLFDGENVSYNDETVDRLLDWLLLSSANTLETISIAFMKQVTRVPHTIASFKSLRKLELHNNNITAIKSGDLSFSVPVTYLDLRSNEINEIEPGAFQGNFTDAKVLLYFNNLTRIDEAVFGPILKQMTSGSGWIQARASRGNTIDCGNENICHLAWLKRYEVIPWSAWYGVFIKCSNGTKFEDLGKAGFNHCI